MRDQMREQLNTEITRKQFLQYMAGALLMVFGFNNLLSLLMGNKPQNVWHHAPGANSPDGFGTRKFGV